MLEYWYVERGLLIPYRTELKKFFLSKEKNKCKRISADLKPTNITPWTASQLALWVTNRPTLFND